MPAPGRNSSKSAERPRAAGRRDAVAQVDAICRRVVAGKGAARTLAGWVRNLGVTETEFRLLWQLAFGASNGSLVPPAPLANQSLLAAQLALSPAQLSGLVERLGAAGLIERESVPHDRRRQAWRIAPAGRALLDSVVARVISPDPAATAQEAA